MTPMISIVDARLPDKAFRIRDFIAACSWKEPCPLSFEDIGTAVKSSRVQVIRHVNLLEKLGYVTVLRHKNRCNVYSIPKSEARSTCDQPQKEIASSKAVKPLLLCPQCGKLRVITKTGACGGCNAYNRIERIAERVSCREIARAAAKTG